MRLSRVVWIVIVALIAGAIAYTYWPPFRLFVLYAIGQSPACPLPHALRADDELNRQVDLKDTILNASRVLENDPKGFHFWQTPKGQFWIPEGDDYVLPFNLAEQERKIYGTGVNGPHAGDIVLDCGANVGVTLREELAGGASKIVAIEPGPENLECLRRNFPGEIASGRILIMPEGVWDKDDILTLRVDPKNSAADTFVLPLKSSVNVMKVPLTTIDHLVRQLKLERVDYIKMDIEGSERQALNGAEETLKRWKPRISVSSYHQPDDPQVLPAIIRKARPDYTMECGPCAETDHGVRPDVLYFR